MKRVNIPIYGGRLFMFTSCSDAYDFAINHSGLEPELPYSRNMDGCVLHHAETGRVLIAVENGSTSTLAHEAVHAAWAILDCVGVRVEPDNHEALAYLVGWVVRSFEHAYVGHSPF